MTAPTTRRAFLSGSVALALTASTTSAAFASCAGRDPIFSRIEAHRACDVRILEASRAWDRAKASGSRSEMEAATRANAAACQHEADMLAALLAEPPETVEGAHALAAYLGSYFADVPSDFSREATRALGNIASTLAGLPRVPRF